MAKEYLLKEDDKLKRTQVKDDAVTSAGGSMAARFLQESKEKRRPLRIPSLGVILYPDGKEEKIEDQG